MLSKEKRMEWCFPNWRGYFIIKVVTWFVYKLQLSIQPADVAGDKKLLHESGMKMQWKYVHVGGKEKNRFPFCESDRIIFVLIPIPGPKAQNQGLMNEPKAYSF